MKISTIVERIDGAIDRYDSRVNPTTKILPVMSSYDLEGLASALYSDLKEIRKMVAGFNALSKDNVDSDF